MLRAYLSVFWHACNHMKMAKQVLGIASIAPSRYLTRSETMSGALQDYQVDWEAILESSPAKFVDEVGSWLYPPAARGQPVNPGTASQYPDPQGLPGVRDVLLTARHRLEALNGPDHPPI